MIVHITVRKLNVLDRNKFNNYYNYTQYLRYHLPRFGVFETFTYEYIHGFTRVISNSNKYCYSEV